MRLFAIHYFIFSFFLVLFWPNFTLSNIVVNTDRGQVIGTMVNLYGQDIYIYRGIPYAMPPINERRFQPPNELRMNWTGVKNASQYSASCPQKTPISWLDQQDSSSQINEDCLYLNVFTPEPSVDGNLSVLVWIHGGRLIVGSGAWWQGQTLAASENIVVVTLNYRLGIFGFMSSGESGTQREFAANNGLLDQQLALKWVAKNIQRFGGDPKRVTIAGNSAGAFSVAYHTIMPSSFPYYRAVIIQSGPLLLDIGSYTLLQVQAQFNLLAQVTNCSRSSTQLSSTCIKELSTEQLLNAQLILLKASFFAFKPVVDMVLLPDNPVTLLNNNSFNKKIKVLTGITKDDGTLSFNSFNGLPHGIDRNTFKQLAQASYGSFGQNAVNAIIYKYSDWHNITSPIANREQMGIANTDAVFLAPTIRCANQYVKQGLPTYFYVFNRRPANSIYFPEYYGATHASEISYVFGYPINPPSSYPEKFVGIDQTVSKKVMRMWANFIKTGNPNDLLTSPQWPQYDLIKKGYIMISNSTTAGNDYKPAALEFWNKYLPTLAANSRPCSTSKPTNYPTNDSTNRPITASFISTEQNTISSETALSQVISQRLFIATVALSVLCGVFMLTTVILAVMLSRRKSQTITKF
ncbi:uncharacterized protein TRIADDRAFT_61104 [Trichoplax adhaerens]|uniref:Carboxylic ester hydrolase n=1 Tax=Trichoplax adhaerens TaxID=10228 RepID=B3SA20_TRIAD|nr:hypothetical protein TRIADDRAFT_61104 [Trichoplax adhaerens]EDV20436.1 hypothetical protein TRIADDRAFT_61104 [Trichoplax adhaerens]|eukprot:XP_002117130.1 hypothetical protein TRIADDRAFT_61104 [Trichoplax adhaerens]